MYQFSLGKLCDHNFVFTGNTERRQGAEARAESVSKS